MTKKAHTSTATCRQRNRREEEVTAVSVGGLFVVILALVCLVLLLGLFELLPLSASGHRKGRSGLGRAHLALYLAFLECTLFAEEVTALGLDRICERLSTDEAGERNVLLLLCLLFLFTSSSLASLLFVPIPLQLPSALVVPTVVHELARIAESTITCGGCQR